MNSAPDLPLKAGLEFFFCVSFILVYSEFIYAMTASFLLKTIMTSRTFFKDLITQVSLEEEHNLDRFIKKVKNPKTGEMDWAFIDVHNPKKIFKYFGPLKPSASAILKELHAVEYFKNR